jgi:hypothetical protein
MPPGAYEARLIVDGQTYTQPFNLLVDPNTEAAGFTAADLVEQFEHNIRVAELSDQFGELEDRVQAALGTLTGAELAEMTAIAGEMFDEPVRYGRPGLEEQVGYLRGLTSGTDRRISRDAIARYEVLKAEVEAMTARVNAIIGAGMP